jgi:hypothetical protein
VTSSGTYSFNLSNAEMVLAAYERVQIRAPSIRQEHMATARREINLLFSEWSNKQVNLWEVTLNSIAAVQGTATYSIPANVVMMLDVYRTLNNGQANQSDIYMTPVSRTEYATYASKFVQGPPTIYWFDRLESPTVTLWPVPDGQGPYTINYYACTQMQDANIPSGETPDIPYRWMDAMVAGLSYRLSKTYAPQLEQVRKADAMEAWQVAATQDTENVPLVLSPGLSGYYRR